VATSRMLLKTVAMTVMVNLLG